MRRLGLIAAIIIVALLAAGGYTASAGAAVYQDLDGGKQALVAAQASMSAASTTGNPAELQSAADQLKVAERHFNDAQARSSTDLALRLVGGVPGAGRQLAASTHLAAIGADMSRAGQGAAEVAIQVAGLKQKYAGRPLSANDLDSALQEAQGIARTYSASIQAIGQTEPWPRRTRPFGATRTSGRCCRSFWASGSRLNLVQHVPAARPVCNVSRHRAAR
jgi:hypothetical protein